MIQFQESTVKEFASWIIARSPDKDSLTHLKVQKLAFYCYGAALSFGFENEFKSKIEFEAWEHGPVNRQIYNELKIFKSEPIRLDHKIGVYSPEAESVLSSALDVYGLLDAWSLRQQSHREEIWIRYSKNSEVINWVEMKKFFVSKFNDGPVEAPEYVFGLSSFKVDLIPTHRFESFDALAKAARKIRGTL